MPFEPPLPRLLREQRAAAGLSQSALAARMRTTQSAVARAESSRPPACTVAFLERFVAATGRPLVASLVPASPAPPTLDELRRLAPRIRRVAARLGLRDIRVVGSVARAEAQGDSDVDLLVAAGPRLTGAAYFAALDEFRETCERITRRQVDVIDEAAVHGRGIHQRLVEEAQPL